MSQRRHRNDRAAGLAGLCAALLLPCAPGASAPPANEPPTVWPRQLLRAEKVRQWTFQKDAAGWEALHDCSLAAKAGRLVVTSTGPDPYLRIPVRAEGGRMLLKLRARCGTAGRGQLFYATARRPGWAEPRSVHFDLRHDGAWHDYEVRLKVAGTLTGLRFDPGGGPGTVEVERLELHRGTLHPLEIVGVRQADRSITVRLRNHSEQPRTVTFGCKGTVVPAGKTVALARPHHPGKPFERSTVTIASPGLPDLKRSVWRCNPGVAAEWITARSGRLAMRVAPDGTGAWVDLDGKCVAAISPIMQGKDIGKRTVRGLADGGEVRAEGTTARLVLKGGEIAFTLRGDRACLAPVVRPLGPLAQGLFAGLEYLGKGEPSSSTLDIETPEHVRHQPDPIKVTMPLMACVTDRASVAMTWTDMSARPLFASPNFIDGADGHMMALMQTDLEAAIRVTPPAPVEDAIAWAVGKIHLPPVPKAPRTPAQQWDLALRSLRGPIAGEGGWGHCAEAKWPRQPYADVASTIWRLTGKAPKLDRLVPGGAHVPNDAIYFVTGRADEWLKMRGSQARGILRRQRPDGSFRYAGKYRRGHFEDTASGHCARPAWELLELAWCTGDREALAAGLKTLEYMKRFGTPRGAQTWELSLHTPDILASAYLVAAYLRGHQLTGKREHLARARRWALSGVPFVYLWGRRPVMTYATVPVYGATNWRAPNWIGLPVQWCGGVYAYWLTKLAPYDKTLDWHKLAEGILLAGEQMQYPDGPLVGCLPDVFYLPDQKRAGPSINPSALVSLRLALAGEVDSLAVAADENHRVCCPWPIELRGGKAHVRARAGAEYQLLIDGKRIVTVRSKGADTVELD